MHTQEGDNELVAELEKKLKLEKEAHERAIEKFIEEQNEKEAQLKKRQATLEQTINRLQQQQETTIEEQVAKLVEERLASVKATTPVAEKKEPEEKDSDGENEKNPTSVELQRRRRRERERALALRKAEEESAAHSLFQRLAQDVREVFHELNLSVVAAEKERLIKDERYRKEREMKDRREEMERAEKLQKELKERGEREEKFWANVEQREDKFRTFLEERIQKDDEEREQRLKRDLEDRATRVRNERELRDEMEKMEKERRAKADSEERERDQSLLRSQIEEIKQQYKAQLDELRHQFDLQYQHMEEIHKSELRAAEKRHEAVTESQLQQFSKQLTLVEKHTGNAEHLEGVIETLRKEMNNTKDMTQQLTAERLETLQQKEKQLQEQREYIQTIVEDYNNAKADLEKERTRVASIHGKFEISLSSFIKNSEEDRRRLLESHAHLDTLRQQAEKDRKMMLMEVAQERKFVEQQQEEFLSKKMEVLSEIQSERMAIARERTEAAVSRERQNRDETDILKSLREREETLAEKIDSIEQDRIMTSELKMEQTRAYQAAVAEREALRREREIFELEKEQLLNKFEEIRNRAEEAAMAQSAVISEQVRQKANAMDIHQDPLFLDNNSSRMQVNLARQRAILQKIGV
ncbi:hypothetical protein, conserved [Angomonas deanei]|uniref:Fas-binding factor 1 C-terminal domain-containing protein n=1 Tax=Angomonas deanei TaxID=59799 RepID=A0A7G2CDT4_9TRYP|nr:hypothetical protein, conserved [Angomonas deanei]